MCSLTNRRCSRRGQPRRVSTPEAVSVRRTVFSRWRPPRCTFFRHRRDPFSWRAPSRGVDVAAVRRGNWTARTNPCQSRRRAPRESGPGGRRDPTGCAAGESGRHRGDRGDRGDRDRGDRDDRLSQWRRRKRTVLLLLLRRRRANETCPPWPSCLSQK